MIQESSCFFHCSVELKVTTQKEMGALTLQRNCLFSMTTVPRRILLHTVNMMGHSRFSPVMKFRGNKNGWHYKMGHNQGHQAALQYTSPTGPHGMFDQVHMYRGYLCLIFWSTCGLSHTPDQDPVPTQAPKLDSQVLFGASAASPNHLCPGMCVYTHASPAPSGVSHVPLQEEKFYLDGVSVDPPFP